PADDLWLGCRVATADRRQISVVERNAYVSELVDRQGIPTASRAGWQTSTLPLSRHLPDGGIGVTLPAPVGREDGRSHEAMNSEVNSFRFEPHGIRPLVEGSGKWFGSTLHRQWSNRPRDVGSEMPYVCIGFLNCGAGRDRGESLRTPREGAIQS